MIRFYGGVNGLASIVEFCGFPSIFHAFHIMCGRYPNEEMGLSFCVSCIYLRVQHNVYVVRVLAVHTSLEVYWYLRTED